MFLIKLFLHEKNELKFDEAEGIIVDPQILKCPNWISRSSFKN